MKNLFAAVSMALVASQAAGDDYDFNVETAQLIVSSILKSEIKDGRVDQLRDSIQKFRAKGVTLLTTELIQEGDAPSTRLVLVSTESGHMEQSADRSKVGDPFLQFTFPHFGSEVKVTSDRSIFHFRRLGVHVTLVSSAPRKQQSEQGGAGQPATRSESDSEGGDKPQSESEGRSR